MSRLLKQSFFFKCETCIILPTDKRNTFGYWDPHLLFLVVLTLEQKSAHCDPDSTRVHRDSACRPPTVALRSSLTLAGLQNDVSRVNEDGDVAVGCAVCRQEALDCLHLLQNSEETKHINTSY